MNQKNKKTKTILVNGRPLKKISGHNDKKGLYLTLLLVFVVVGGYIAIILFAIIKASHDAQKIDENYNNERNIERTIKQQNLS